MQEMGKLNGVILILILINPLMLSVTCAPFDRISTMSSAKRLPINAFSFSFTSYCSHTLFMLVNGAAKLTYTHTIFILFFC